MCSSNTAFPHAVLSIQPAVTVIVAIGGVAVTVIVTGGGHVEAVELNALEVGFEDVEGAAELVKTLEDVDIICDELGLLVDDTTFVDDTTLDEVGDGEGELELLSEVVVVVVWKNDEELATEELLLE